MGWGSARQQANAPARTSGPTPSHRDQRALDRASLTDDGDHVGVAAAQATAEPPRREYDATHG
jgi:hypothetical protein